MARTAPADLFAAFEAAAGNTYRLDGVDYTIWNNPAPWLTTSGDEEIINFSVKAVRVADGSRLSTPQELRQLINSSAFAGSRSVAEWRDIAREIVKLVMS